MTETSALLEMMGLHAEATASKAPAAAAGAEAGTRKIRKVIEKGCRNFNDEVMICSEAAISVLDGKKLRSFRVVKTQCQTFRVLCFDVNLNDEGDVINFMRVNSLCQPKK